VDRGIEAYDAGGERAEVFFVRPARPKGSVIVIHTVAGLTDHIRETCDRLGRLGFTAAAPLLYWRQKDLFTAGRIRRAMAVVWDLDLEERYDKAKLGGIMRKKAASSETASLLRTLYDRTFRSQILFDLTRLAEALEVETDAVGAIGYSMGGKLAVQLGTEFRGLRACVTFSAEPPPREVIEKVEFPVLALYGVKDEFMGKGVPAFVGDALKAGMALTLKTYPRARHEFFDPAKKRSYNQSASDDAWKATTGFIMENLLVRGG